jgi:hypothetical protein
MPVLPTGGYQRQVATPQGVPRTDVYEAPRVVDTSKGLQVAVAGVAQAVQTESARRDDVSLMEYERKLAELDARHLLGDQDNPGALRQEGRNAFGVTRRTLSNWDRDVAAIEPKFLTQDAQARAMQLRNVRREDNQRRLSTFEFEQSDKALAQEMQASLDSNTNEAIANADDLPTVDASLARGRNLIAARAQRKGLGEAETTAALSTWESSTLRQVIASQMTRNPLTALATFKARAGSLLGDDRIAVEQALKPVVMEEQGRALGGSFYAGQAPHVAAGTASLYDSIHTVESGNRHYGADGGPLLGPAPAAGGARSQGIGQMQPATAEAAAKAAGIPWNPALFNHRKDGTPADDAAVAYNLQLSRAHIDSLVTRFGGNVAAVAAAYNMGPEAAAAWMAGKPYRTQSGKLWTPSGPMDMQAMPDETRAYVGKVLGKMGGEGAPIAPPQTMADVDAAEASGLERAYALKAVNPSEGQAAEEDVRERAGIDRQRLQGAERAGEAAKVELRDQHENVLAKLQDGVPVPVSERLTDAQLLQVYGPIEGKHKIAEQATFVRLAPDRALLRTAAPAQARAILAKYKADPTSTDYAFDKNVETAMATAWQDVQKRRSEDPMLFAAQEHLYGVGALDVSNPGQQWYARDRAAQQMQAQFGTPYRLLTTDEASAFSGALAKGTATDKLNLLSQTRDALSERGFGSVMGQVAVDQPLTAAAGSLLSVADATVTVNGAPLSGKRVATTILAGAELLNPPKGGSKVELAADTLLRASFNDFIGNAYAGHAQAQEQAFQAYRAYYAARASEKGEIGVKTLDSALASEAAIAVTGGIGQVNDSRILLPWGISEDTFARQAEQVWPRVREMAGLPENMPFERVGFTAVGGDSYYVMAGDTPIRNAKTGLPLQITLGRKKPATGGDLNDSMGTGYGF